LCGPGFRMQIALALLCYLRVGTWSLYEPSAHAPMKFSSWYGTSVSSCTSSLGLFFLSSPFDPFFFHFPPLSLRSATVSSPRWYLAVALKALVFLFSLRRTPFSCFSICFLILTFRHFFLPLPVGFSNARRGPSFPLYADR